MKRFYAIHENEDGTVDVYLHPDIIPKTTEDGLTDYDIAAAVVRGVQPFDGLEDDIRARYSSWCESAEYIYL